MAQPLPKGLVNSIIDKIETAYLSKGWRFFFPQQFEQSAPLEQVVLALATLRASDQLDATAIVQCVNGHQVWAGEPEEALKHIHDPCPTCLDEAIEDPVLKFEMTAPWQTRL